MRNNLLIIIFLLPMSLIAQDEGVGNWIMYFGSNRISDKFSIHTEVQYRNHTIIPNNIEQLLLRTGLNWHFDDNAFATAGYGYIPSYVFDSPQSEPETTEHRIWQQLIMNNKVGRVKFEHRYRLEQRWVNDNYKTRYRYRLMMFIPLNKPVIETGTFYLGFYDEIFVNHSKTFFDRNRLYGALGYQFSSTLGAQLGVLNQQVNDFHKWYFQMAVIYNPDLR